MTMSLLSVKKITLLMDTLNMFIFFGKSTEGREPICPVNINVRESLSSH